MNASVACGLADQRVAGQALDRLLLRDPRVEILPADLGDDREQRR